MGCTIIFRTLLVLLISLAWGVSAVPTWAIAAANPGRSEPRAAHLAFATPQLAPLFEQLGNHHMPMSTQNALAQRYFDQGLTLAYGFNHDEAAHSFQSAAQLDPACAMCYWGLAYVLGPNINAPMDPENVTRAWQALQTALQLSEQASDREQAYIHALAARYQPNDSALMADQAQRDQAYANAMRQVAQRFPDDLDAATLFAEALMDTTPWKYWAPNGEPSPAGAEILKTLESVLSRNPNHPGANHFYIHAVEKQHPELGIAAADRLSTLVPGAGHLVHMPSHIYLRVGRLHDAVLANQNATQVDQDYVIRYHPQGVYPLAYRPHNPHFLWYAATLAGQQSVALQAAQQTAALVNPQLMRQPGYGTLQHYASIPMYTWVTFGQWDQILNAPAPASDLVYPTGVWHYARGMAFANRGDRAAAVQELEALRAIATSPQLEGVTIWDINSTASLLAIAVEVLTGEIAAEHGDYAQAIAHLKTAVALEDQLNYDEPAPWHSPVRQTLGAVLLDANQPAQAEQVYRADLAAYPNNGWSLFGLAQSLRAQGKTQAAETVQAQFQDAWAYADIQIERSRI